MVIKAKKIRVEVGPVPKRKEKDVIYFEDFQSMNEVLTQNRIELLETIRRQQPESIYQLAEMVKRDQGNVTKDVNLLEEHGFIEINRTQEGRRMKSEPRVEGDAIEMIIRLGVGTLGLAKDAASQLADEMSEERMAENKSYARKTYSDAAKPVRRAAKAFAEELDKAARDE